MIYFLIFFGLGLEFETNQVSPALALPYPPNLAWRNKEWMKVGSKWKCKIGIYIVACCVKWLLTNHLKEVHGLVIEKAKPRKPSSSKGNLRD